MGIEEAIGEKLHEDALKGKLAGDKVLESMQDKLVALNKRTSNKAEKMYDSVFRRLQLDASGLVVNSVENMSLVQMITTGLDPILDEYRKEYGTMFRDHREDLFSVLAEKEERIEKDLSGIGIREDRKAMTHEAFGTMAIIDEKGLKRINSMLLKWKDTVYDTFVGNVARGPDLIGFRKSFFNKDGSVRIGSSLDEDAIFAAMMSVTEQRTAFLRDKAKENGYDYCWNSNPMDPRTKSICAEASLSGVIPESQMLSEHGAPPRYICRCELVYTRGSWVGVNKGINSAIRDRRLKMLDDLKDAPKQKGWWYWNGKKIYSRDDLKRAGGLMYKDIKDKIAFIESKNVPDFVPPLPTPPTTPPLPPPAITGPFSKDIHNSKYNEYLDMYKGKTAKELRDEYRDKIKNGRIGEALDDWQASTHRDEPAGLKLFYSLFEPDAIQAWVRQGGAKKASEIADQMLKSPEFVDDWIRLRAMTQAYLESNNVKRLTLYRGTDGERSGPAFARRCQKAKDDAIRAGRDWKNEIVEIDENSMMGWTTDYGTATQFGENTGGVTITVNMPADDILVSHDIWAKRIYKDEMEFICKGKSPRRVKLEDCGW